MRKKFTCVIVLAMLAVSMMAANLPLKIAGIQVTDENADDLMSELQTLNLQQLSGSITYEPSQNLLTLEDFMMNGIDKDVIGLEVDGYITVLLRGKSYLNNFKHAVKLADYAQVMFCGPGALEVQSQLQGNAPFVQGDQTKLSFNYANLKVISATSAFTATKGESAVFADLVFSNSEIAVEYSHKPLETGYGVENISTLSMVYSKVALMPEQDVEGNYALKVSALDLKLTNLSVQNADQYEFSPAKKTYEYGALDVRALTWDKDLNSTKYFAAINGRLNNGNEFVWPDVSKGVARYVHHPADRDTLYLDGAHLGSMPCHPNITLYAPAVIYMTGECDLSSHEVPTIYSESNGVQIVGDGSARVMSWWSSGIYAPSLWIQSGVTMTVLGDDYGYCNPQTSTSDWVLMIDGSADVTLFGGINMPAMHLNSEQPNKGLSLRYGNIVAFPYDPNEVFYAQKVRFAKPEWEDEREIFGHAINSFNADHLHEVIHATETDSELSGYHLKFNPDTKELECWNMTVVNSENPEGKPFFYAAGSEVKMKVWGENRISLMSDQPTNVIEANGDFSLEGVYENPSLTITGSDDAANTFVQLGDNAEMRMYNVTVKATTKRGIRGKSSSSLASLNFVYADVILAAKKEVYSNIAEMIFDHSRILAPSGAKFSAADMSIVDEKNEIVKDGTVWIESFTDMEGVENVTMDNGQWTKAIRDGQLIIFRDGKIFNAQGVEMK